jgi:molybdopterin converting factor small subunit
MRVQVRLFARAKDLAGGASSIMLDLPEGASIGQLRRRLAEETPALAALLERSVLAVRDEFVNDETTLTPGADVALLPPVSGGCR